MVLWSSKNRHFFEIPVILTGILVEIENFKKYKHFFNPLSFVCKKPFIHTYSGSRDLEGVNLCQSKKKRTCIITCKFVYSRRKSQNVFHILCPDTTFAFLIVRYTVSQHSNESDSFFAVLVRKIVKVGQKKKVLKIHPFLGPWVETLSPRRVKLRKPVGKSINKTTRGTVISVATVVLIFTLQQLNNKNLGNLPIFAI